MRHALSIKLILLLNFDLTFENVFHLPLKQAVDVARPLLEEELAGLVSVEVIGFGNLLLEIYYVTLLLLEWLALSIFFRINHPLVEVLHSQVDVLDIDVVSGFQVIDVYRLTNSWEFDIGKGLVIVSLPNGLGRYDLAKGDILKL